jgi:hypothetical protein
MKKIIPVLWLSLLLFVAKLDAQEVTGSIVGTVTDTKGGTVTDAKISITDTDKGVVVRDLKTDASGSYAASFLPAGNYSVGVEAQGFKSGVANGIKLEVNEHRTQDFQLQVGSKSETVTVTADALQVDLQTAQSQTVITGTQIQELAVNTRNYEQLVTLMPGVSTGLASDQLYMGVSNPVGTSNQINFSVNGSRPTQNAWLLDGSDNVDRGANLTLLAYPSLDSIQEFSVQRGQYGAEYGRSSAAEINVITKSGTSGFHGDLYEFFRNDDLAANNWLNNADGIGRPPLRYNDFGGTIGGPIYIPGVYNTDKKKTFFFYSQEVRRVITYTSLNAIVPTAAERQGNFPTAVCFVPLTSSGACPAGESGTSVPSISPAAQAYLTDIIDKLPPPADPTCVSSCNVTVLGRNIFNGDQEILRIDQVFSPKFTMFGRFENDAIPTQEPFGLFTGNPWPGVSSTTTNAPGRIWTVHATYSISTTTVNDIGFNYSHGAVLSTPTGTGSFTNSPDIAKAIALPFTDTLDRVPSLNFNFTEGEGNVVGFGPYRDYNDNYNFFDNLTHNVGRHSLKFGFAYNHYQKSEDAGSGNQGNFYFSSLDPAGNTTEAQEFANFLEGNVAEFTQTSQDFRAVIEQNEFEMYAQDTYRLRPNLTLSFGLRYSLFRQPTDANGHLTAFDPAAFSLSTANQVDPCTGSLGIQTGTCANPNVLPPTGNPLDGIIIGGKNSPYGNAVGRQNNRDFGPRFGFAWDPFGTGKTSVRGGYGIYYDSPSIGWYEQAVFNNAPFVNSDTIFNTTLANPAGPNSPGNSAPLVHGANPDWHTPYTQEWSLDVQRELLPRLLLDIGYYGNKGTHLIGDVDINEPTPDAYVTALAPYGVTAPIATFGASEQLNYIRPYLGYDAMNIWSTSFTSNYNGLQISLQKRLGSNSLINVNYTWSHALTDAPSDYATPMITSEPHLDYGPAQFDRRHIFNANWVYFLPFFQKQQGVVGHLLGGWEYSGIVSYFTGLPYTAYDFNFDPVGVGLLDFFSPAAGRPNINGNPNANAPHTFAQWINPNVFSEIGTSPTNPQTTPGNAAPGIMRGPGQERWDMSLFKNTNISEGVKLQFRAEATNVFNHTNFSGLNNAFGFGGFGGISGVRDPRIMQLGLKLYY